MHMPSVSLPQTQTGSVIYKSGMQAMRQSWYVQLGQAGVSGDASAKNQHRP
jgi:hypothetical protein